MKQAGNSLMDIDIGAHSVYELKCIYSQFME